MGRVVPSTAVRAEPGVDPAIVRARAYLSRVAEPANVALWALVCRIGPVEAAEAVRTGLADQLVLGATEARRASVDADADLEAADRHGVRLVVPESPDWPHFALAALEVTGRERARAERAAPSALRDSGEPVPPLALWVRGRGELASLAVRSVGIVGARAATSYGEYVTTELGYGLARAGVVVVSGGAYGIDAAAHRSALAGGGPSVLVSAAGLDRPYPAAHTALYEQVADTGLVISESPPGAAPHRHRFLSRNRLIAAFATGTVVVEAARRSGAANTAHHAFTQGRPVMAVPGPVTSAMSAGTHDLLRREPEPALLVTGVEDVLALVGGLGEASEKSSVPTASDLRGELDQLPHAARRVFEGVPARTPARPDAIARRSGVPELEVIRALPELEAAGLIESSDAGYRVARRPPTKPNG